MGQIRIWVYVTTTLLTAAVTTGMQQNLTAQEILAAMGRAYAQASSYQDSGLVTTTIVQATSRTTETRFTTAFVRDKRQFRFEYQKRSNAGQTTQYIIWQD